MSTSPCDAADTEAIVALASGPLPSAIAVLRLSGTGCHWQLQACLRAKGRAWQDGAWTPRYLQLCHFVDPQDPELVIDAPLVVFFQEPRSFTGQESAELHLHGGPYVVERVLAVLQAQGVRLAEPGEFSRRAYLAGKLDLSQAEGIQALIGAQTEHQWLAARQLVQGRLRQYIEGLRAQVIDALAWLEAAIDFPDEKETAQVELTQVDAKVTRVATALSQLLHSYDSGRITHTGLRVVLVGQPNAGKSTLLNELLGRQRALVSPQAGTTRDYLEEPCVIQGRLLRLIDTAGLRHTTCPIEQAGIEQALDLAKGADILITLLPADSPADPQMPPYGQALAASSATQIAVLTKADLGEPTWWSKIKGDKLAISIRSQDHQGLDALRAFLVACMDTHINRVDTAESFICQLRHKQALEAAYTHVQAYQRARNQHAYEDMLAYELQALTKALEMVIGRVDTDDILDEVFSSFCVGK